MTSTILVFPGHGNSGPDHWQTRWEQGHPGLVRVRQRDWERPERGAWVETFERAVRTYGPGTVVVAHSLACLAVAHWASQAHSPIRAALLVAVPDPTSAAFPGSARDFGPVPLEPLPFPSTLVASSDDPFATPDHSRRIARAWGSQLAEIGPAGHVNASSPVGSWPEGWELLQELLRRAG